MIEFYLYDIICILCYSKPEDLANPPPQIADVQRSWNNMRAGRNAMVSSLFIKLFKEIPRVQQYFDKFAAVPVDAFPVILNSTNRSLW